MTVRRKRTDGPLARQAARCRAEDTAFARWARGYGLIRHRDLTQVRIRELGGSLAAEGARGGGHLRR